MEKRSERLPMNSSGWFLDSGQLDEIRKWREVIGGVTTNQVILFSKEGIFDIPAHMAAMCELVGPDFPISLELPDSAASTEDMVALACHYHDLHPTNTVVKVPIIPDDPKGLKVIATLAGLGVRTNATIGINSGQLILAAEAARKYAGEGACYISLFWGRAQESAGRGESQTPENVLEATLTYLANHQLDTRIIVGSIRQPQHVIDAFANGADIVTVPPKIFEQIMVTSRAKETLDEFDEAYRRVQNDPRLILS